MTFASQRSMTKHEWKYYMPYVIFIDTDVDDSKYTVRNFIRCKLGTTKMEWQPIMIYDAEIYLYDKRTYPWKSAKNELEYYLRFNRAKFKLLGCRLVMD